MKRLQAGRLIDPSPLVEMVKFVLKNFEESEAQGYRSKDRQFAIELLRKGLEPSPLLVTPAQDVLPWLRQAVLDHEHETYRPSQHYLGLFRGAIAEIERLRAMVTCKARQSATDPPQDCDWPRCGCDPYADKVIAAIEESGFEIVRALVDPSPPAQFELNAWRELGEEMGRVISLMPKDLFEDWFPDWFGPRLFDLQVQAARVDPSPPALDLKYLSQVADRIIETDGCCAHDWLVGVAQTIKRARVDPSPLALDSKGR